VSIKLSNHRQNEKGLKTF